MKNKFVIDGKDYGMFIDTFQIELLKRFIDIYEIKIPSECDLEELLVTTKLLLVYEKYNSDRDALLSKWRDSISDDVAHSLLENGDKKDNLSCELVRSAKTAKGSNKVKAIHSYLFYSYSYCLRLPDLIGDDYGFISGFISYLCYVETPRFKEHIIKGNIKSLDNCYEYIKSIHEYTFIVFGCEVLIKASNSDLFRLYSFLENAGYILDFDINEDGSETKPGLYVLSVNGFSSIA